ncbi:hypothetical protein O3M35_003314 [Rhynocoris fuscipes]|uniref:BING4 C-terminal domain-containing protein n=1 Tax=Rhynocoris fuscipes TaxID=488301 RepID=A0AAW1CQE9_9HEMI
MKVKNKNFRSRPTKNFKTSTLKKVAPLRKNKSKYDVSVPKKLLEKYSRGEGIDGNVPTLGDLSHKKKLLRKEKKIQWAVKQAARAEILLTEESGYIIPDEGEETKKYSQNEIKRNVDITSATKFFDLDLAFGPYRLDYSRNGRHLLIGGRKGHVAAMDWVTKDLLCEINVMEEVFDVQWLHIETMFAVAQKDWVFIYDNQGVELHCLKQLHKVFQMAFLPHHFLLATASQTGWIKWLDISLGKLISEFPTKFGRLRVMTHNPYNAVLCLGHAKGVVSMWSPNSNKPLAQMLCHNTCVQGIAIDRAGRYMATSSVNNQLKIWDIRSLVGPVQSYILGGSPTDLSFSQQGLLATAIGRHIDVYKNCHIQKVSDQYLTYQNKTPISNIEFCPYEDVLGIGCDRGFTSILVPGAGEPNFDALEVNPMQSKQQRKEAEVKALLEKIQPEMISLDPTVLTEVDVPTLKDRIDAKVKLLNLKPPDINFVPRKKKRGNTARAAKVKKIVKESRKKVRIFWF